MTDDTAQLPRTSITSPARAEDTLPAAADFFLRSPLYQFYRFGQSDYLRMREILDERLTLDAYCAHCGKMSVFQRPTQNLRLSSGDVTLDRSSSATFRCVHDGAHQLWFRLEVRSFMHAVNDSHRARIPEIGKIGQWPTFADLQTGELARHRKVLGKQASELTKAFGLAAHGIGIGAFVYLRRVFESLIQDAHERARAAHADFPEEKFQAGRMDDRIMLLQKYLPAFLVERRAIYGILSKGIHQLTEHECLRHFDVVRQGIEMILDERAHELERAAKRKSAGDALARLQGQLPK